MVNRTNVCGEAIRILVKNRQYIQHARRTLKRVQIKFVIPWKSSTITFVRRIAVVNIKPSTT